MNPGLFGRLTAARRVRIPRHVVSAAVQHAMNSRGQEVGGLFGLGVDGMVRYLPGVNIASDPVRSVELSAAWIDEVLRRFEPVSFFHSHPGRLAEPSSDDVLCFPVHYVRECLIYYGDSDRLVSYDVEGWTIRKVGVDGVLVEMLEL